MNHSRYALGVIFVPVLVSLLGGCNILPPYDGPDAVNLRVLGDRNIDSKNAIASWKSHQFFISGVNAMSPGLSKDVLVLKPGQYAFSICINAPSCSLPKDQTPVASDNPSSAESPKNGDIIPLTVSNITSGRPPYQGGGVVGHVAQELVWQYFIDFGEVSLLRPGNYILHLTYKPDPMNEKSLTQWAPGSWGGVIERVEDRSPPASQPPAAIVSGTGTSPALTINGSLVPHGNFAAIMAHRIGLKVHVDGKEVIKQYVFDKPLTVTNTIPLTPGSHKVEATWLLDDGREEVLPAATVTVPDTKRVTVEDKALTVP